MVSDRPYRASLGREEALRRLRHGAGTQWDARFVGIFLGLAGSGAVDELIAESAPVGAEP